MKNSWKTLDSKEIYKNPWIRVREDKVIKPNNKEGIYGVVESNNNAVFIVALNKDRKVILIKLFRYPTQLDSIEIPSGAVEPKEELIEAAKRELKEETGFAAKKWDKAGKYFSFNGVCNSPCHVFVAQDLEHVERAKDKEEGIEKWFAEPFDEVLKMINNGEITDGDTIGSIMIAGMHLNIFEI